MITLATLPKATAQEVFDQVSVHLLKQGSQSGNYMDNQSRRFLCRYKDDSGNKCAAGCLISDEEYNLSLEEKSWDTLVMLYQVPNTHVDLISSLQDIHDNVSVSEWKDSLYKLAIDHALNTDCLKEFK